ncbi:nucleotide exchange factor GrpE [Candidatus Gracilibacteria bacterium HOT-871]|nr:nucleotide exchange factor GrpE [Candidatus Gracilibacteria bacterium HOT-871]MBB1564548.1 nucleotide exchange factor GrpE [Candidatus Gracilibacteria bacterium]RKW21750.1 MAG: nucleotide exchange factor GrpE [Candidatus Gracilibacteria bacterium]
MSNKDKNTIEEDDILENMEEEIEQMEKDEESEKPSEASQNPEVDKTKDILTKTLADFDNYKKRVERDKKDMIFFLKSDILKKILPRVDDLERIIKNTPKDFQENIVFEGVVSLHKKLLQDLESLGVVPFDSIGKQVDPEFHDVMTVAPGGESGIIFDEFEKGYLLEGKVLRHAKVIVGT